MRGFLLDAGFFSLHNIRTSCATNDVIKSFKNRILFCFFSSRPYLCSRHFVLACGLRRPLLRLAVAECDEPIFGLERKANLRNHNTLAKDFWAIMYKTPSI